MYKIKFNFWLYCQLTLLLIAVLIVSACAPASSVNDFVVSRQSTPTSSETLVAAQSTEPVSTQVPLQMRLAVIKSRAQIIWGGSVQNEIQQAQSADIKINNGIEMLRLDEQNQQSYGILYLPDLVNVELFANTKLYLTDAKQSSQGSAQITLDLENGHVFVHLNQERASRVTVRTPYATIQTLTRDADFDVCRAEDLTCVMVKRGVVEIVTKDGRDIVRAGSAGIVLSEQPLSPGICAPTAKFMAWEERYRLSSAASSLQEEIAELPQTSCPMGTDGFPLNARILYQDEFSGTSRGWNQGKTDQFTAGYIRSSGARYYQVQVSEPAGQYLAFIPNERDYGDVNIDIKTRTESVREGDFRYGVVLRRTGDQYYAFVVSPVTRAWYFLKSSSEGLGILKYGVEKRMRGLDGQDTLRIESYGSTFLLFINGRFVDWISDPDYARGEVGFFVDSIDNPDALINFNSITIWDIPAPALQSAQGENCFNAIDDDGDEWIDQADPNCQSSDLIETALPNPSPLPTNTPRTVITPTAAPPATNPSAPTATSRPPATQPSIPTLSLPTVVVPLPTLPLPLPTISLPLPTISLPLPLLPPAGTPIPE